MLRSAVPVKARSFLARDQSLRGTLSHLHRGQDKVAFGLRSGTRRGCVRTREHTRARGPRPGSLSAAGPFPFPWLQSLDAAWC